MCGKNEKLDAQDMLSTLVKNVFQQMRDRFEEEFHGQWGQKVASKRKAKASAWYIVTRLKAGQEPNSYHGLPWTLSPLLTQMASENKAQSASGHDCVLMAFGDKSSIDGWDNIPSDAQKVAFEKVAIGWFEKQLKSGVFGALSQNQNVKDQLGTFVKTTAEELLKPSLVDDQKLLSLDALLVQFFERLVDKINSILEFDSNEPLNNLAISAMISLFRFLRLKKVDAALKVEDVQKQILTTICLSLKDSNFREYVENNQSDFLHKIKGSGVSDIACNFYRHSIEEFSVILVSAIGSNKALNRLRTEVTKKCFYDEIRKTTLY
jgi:hypothetical protein